MLLPIIRLDTPTFPPKTQFQLTQQSLIHALPHSLRLSFSPLSCYLPVPFACEWQSIVWATFRFWFLSHKYWQAAYASLYIYVSACVWAYWPVCQPDTFYTFVMMSVHLSESINASNETFKKCCKRRCCNHFNLFKNIRNAFSLSLSLFSSRVCRQKKYFNNFAV